jgi:hypothetical protein
MRVPGLRFRRDDRPAQYRDLLLEALALDEAGHDMQRRAGAFDAREPGGDAVQVHGHVQIGRFLPALGAADHAAGDHRQRRLGAQPVAAGLFEGQLEAAEGMGRGRAVLQGLRQAHDAPGQMACIQGVAGRVQAIGAQGRGAPVQRDQGRLLGCC